MIERDTNLFSFPFSLKKRDAEPFPLNRKDIFFCGYARTALFEGLKLLQIKNGDSVLVPGYICGAALSAMRHLGITIRYYPLKDNLTPDWPQVKQAMDKTIKAMLVVNYFGFPNDLTAAGDFCRQYGVYLLEDNAHGYLSYNGAVPLGSYGDISIFSFRKTLPTPNGAALLINNNKIKRTLAGEENYTDSRVSFLRFSAKSLIRYLGSMLPIRRCAAFRADLRAIASGKENEEELNLPEYFSDFHPFGRALFKYMDFKRHSQQRCQAYGIWLDFFSRNKEFNVRLPFASLEKGVVPYVFPVLSENRESLLVELYKRGIESFPWPTLPFDSRESYFSQRIACLPLVPEKAIRAWSKKWIKK